MLSVSIPLTSGLWCTQCHAATAHFKAVSSELDRNIKAEKGGRLYERPDSQLVAEICIGPKAVRNCSHTLGNLNRWKRDRITRLVTNQNVEKA